MYSPPGTPGVVDPQAIMPDYLNHNKVADLAGAYTEDANEATKYGKPFIMFEMNSASCGGFPGISDTFTSTLWALDYGLQMATQNTSHALLHIGGQNVFYNVSPVHRVCSFTSCRSRRVCSSTALHRYVLRLNLGIVDILSHGSAPPTNQIGFNQWTVGPIFYAALVIAEAFGKSNTSQIVDRWANEANPNTPVYAIYERGVLSKAALFNYIDDPSGNNALTVSLTVDGGVPASVSVKYVTFHPTTVPSSV